MPTNRTRRKHERVEAVDPTTIWRLSDRCLYPKPEGRQYNAFADLRARDDRQTWTQIAGPVLEDWARAFPGTRPEAWWAYSAPGQRRRFGGVGTPCHECLNYVENYHYGIPDFWVNPGQVSYYNGRSRDIHGQRIGTEYREGHFAGVAIDPIDPPRYESQAAYLDRHDLFLPGERRRLTDADFERELVSP